MLKLTTPQKTREIHSNHFDSTIWNAFQFRPDDIIIASYAKSGTTWLQQIVSQLIFNGAKGLPVAQMSPWMDLRVPPAPVKLEAVEAQEHRRFVKTHLPVDALVFSPEAKYIYISRDARDIVWSLYNHHINANEKWYGALNETPGLVGPPMEKPVDDILLYFKEWLDQDGYPFWPFWENVRSWWEIRELPNVKLIHFANLKKDLEGQVKEIADFLEIPLDDSILPVILEQCSFSYMKANADESVPLGGMFWEGGSKTFIHKGVNGRWMDMLPESESRRYEEMAQEKLGSRCANWVMTGEDSLLI